MYRAPSLCPVNESEPQKCVFHPACCRCRSGGRSTLLMLSSSAPITCSLYFLNAPLVFWGVWRVVSPFVHAATRRKIHFIGGAAGRRQLLDRIPAQVCVPASLRTLHWPLPVCPALRGSLSQRAGASLAPGWPCPKAQRSMGLPYVVRPAAIGRLTHTCAHAGWHRAVSIGLGRRTGQTGNRKDNKKN